MPTDTKTAPIAAAQFDAGPLTFAAPGENTNTAPVELLARSAEPVNHWYWGRCVHDLDGVQTHKPSIPIDYCHDPGEILGYSDKLTRRDDALVADGKLVLHRDRPADRAAEIIDNAAAGVPYEASIYFDPSTLVIEEASADQTIEANGRTYQGPITVFRKWGLRGIAVCPYGYDKHTAARFAAGDAPTFTVPIHKDEPMPETTPPADANATQQTAPETPPADATPETQQTEPATPPAAPATELSADAIDPATLDRFVEKFGADDGVKWLREGLSYEQALERHADKLAADNANLAQRLDAAAVATGDDNPAEFGTDPKDEPNPKTPATPEKRGSLSYEENLEAFKAATKIPSRN